MEYNKKIDSYNVFDKIAVGTEQAERLRDVVITYFSDGKIFYKSKIYRKVSEEKIKKVKEKLFELVMHNLNVSSVSYANTFLTIVFEVEKILIDQKI